MSFRITKTVHGEVYLFTVYDHETRKCTIKALFHQDGMLAGEFNEDFSRIKLDEPIVLRGYPSATENCKLAGYDTSAAKCKSVTYLTVPKFKARELYNDYREYFEKKDNV